MKIAKAANHRIADAEALKKNTFAGSTLNGAGTATPPNRELMLIVIRTVLVWPASLVSHVKQKEVKRR